MVVWLVGGLTEPIREAIKIELKQRVGVHLPGELK